MMPEFSTYFDELFLWLVTFDYPMQLLMFLLNLLPVQVFKTKLAKAMVTFYPMVAYNLSKTEDDAVIQRINERIVHISVQIFCNELVVNDLVAEGNILAVFMACFKTLVGNNSDLTGLNEITLGHPMIHKMQYWALASDLQNILLHDTGWFCKKCHKNG